MPVIPLLSGPLSRQTLVHFVFFANLALATLQNTTVDDAVLTGAVVPQYLPSLSDWNIGNNCSGCLVKPNPSLAYNGTWHDATYSPSNSYSQAIEFTFTGSALYIFFIIANTVPYATTLTDVEFVLDNGVAAGMYIHTPGTTTDYQYNVPVYVNESLASGQHTMTIQPVNSGNNVLMLFDYLIYATDISSPTSTSATSSPTSATSSSASATSTATQGTSSGLNISAIVGAVCGVLVLVIASLLCYWRYKRRRSGRRPEEGVVAEPFFSTAEERLTSPICPTSSTDLMRPSFAELMTGPSIVTLQSSIPPASTTVFSSFGAQSSVAPGIIEQVEQLRAEVAHLRNLHDVPPEYSMGETD